MKKFFKSRSFEIISIIILLIIAFILAGWLNDIKNKKGFPVYKYNQSLNISDDLQKIIYYGTLAANSHNSQMWKVKIVKDDQNNKEIIVKQDKTKLLSTLDPTNRETMICIGAFIGNVEISSKALGYDYTTKVLANNYFDDDIVSITFTKNSRTIDNNILGLMRITDTDRKNYLKTPISQTDVDYISSIDKNNILFYPKNTNEANYIESGIIGSLTTFEKNENMMKELEKWTRFSNSEAFETKDGLTPEMEAQPMIIRQLLYSIGTSKIIDNSLFKKLDISATKSQLKNCAGYIAITSDNNSVKNLVNVGRELQEFWIKGTEKNIAMGPLTTILLFSPWQDEISSKLSIPNKKVNMILRIGYVKQIRTPVSMRKDISQIIE